MISPVYHNLNRIDSILKEEFGSENVKLIKIKDKKTFDFSFVVEFNEYKMKMFIGERETLMIERGISWSYLSDSNNESSSVVERESTVDSLSKDIRSIFEKKMFSKPYLESVMVLINENKNVIIEEGKEELFLKEDDFIEVSKNELESLLKEYDLDLIDSDIKDDRIILQTSSDVLSMSKRVNITNKLNSFSEVDMAWFNDDVLNITFDVNVFWQ